MVLRTEMAALRDTRREVTEIGSAMSGLPLRLEGAVLLKSWRPIPEVIGAVLLKSWRPIPKVVGGSTAEVEKVYP